MLNLLIIVFTKILLPLTAIVISALALLQKWTFRTDRLFDKYSKLSKFTFELSKRTEDERLEKISKEYGYAAITREKRLSHEERLTLLNMVNPINGIEEYHKCADCLQINIVDGCFAWKNKLYKNKFYRFIIISMFFIIYVTGAVLLFSPVFYPLIQNTPVGDVYHQLTPEKKMGVLIFVMIYGATLSVLGLNNLAKLSGAEGLIKKSILKQ